MIAAIAYSAAAIPIAAAQPVAAVRFVPESPADALAPGEGQAAQDAAWADLVAIPPGSRPTPPDLRRALQTLAETGLFATVAIVETWTPEGRVLVFKYRRERLLVGWTFEANRALDGDTLARALDLKWGMPAHAERFTFWSDALAERYVQAGFPDARARFELRHAGPGRAELVGLVEEGRPVRVGKVEVTFGEPAPPRPVTAEEARRLLPVEPGAPLAADAVPTGTERIEERLANRGYLTGRASHTFVVPGKPPIIQHQRAIASGVPAVDIELQVAAGPRVLVSVVGDALLGDDLMQGALVIYQRRSIDNGDLAASAERLRELFRANGYLGAEVAYETFGDDRERHITFKVAAGPRTRVRAIAFTGNQTFDAGTLMSRLATRPAGPLWAGAPFNPTTWQADVEAIRAYYVANGFLDVRVDARKEPVLASHDVALAVSIDEGPRSVIRGIHFGLADAWRPAAGAPAFKLADCEPGLLQALTVGPGMDYDPVRLDRHARELETYLAGHGYPQATVQGEAVPASVPDPPPGTRLLTLRFKLDPGPFHTFGRTVVRGNVSTKLAVIERNIPWKRGAPYDAGAVLEAQQRLYQLGFFDRVELAPLRPEDSQRELDMLVGLRERETGWLAVGGGFGDALGLQASVEMTQNNLLGTGRSLTFGGLLGQRRTALDLSLRDPALGGDGLMLGDATMAFQRDRPRPDLLVQSVGPTLGLSRQIADGVLGNLRYSYSRTSYLEYTATDLARAGALDRNNGIVGAGLTYDTRSSLLDPRWGSKLDLNVDTASTLFGGDVSYVRPRAVWSQYIPFSSQPNLLWAGFLPLPRRVTLALGGEMGIIQALGATRVVPSDLLFLAGGPTSLRGYPYNGVGTADAATGKVLGGQMLAVGHAELRFPVYGDFGGVTFIDAGDVWADPGAVLQVSSLRDLKVTAGFGVRYATPVGPVRVDFAWRLRPVFAIGDLVFGLGHAF